MTSATFAGAQHSPTATAPVASVPPCPQPVCIAPPASCSQPVMLRPLTSPRSRVYDALNVLEAVGILAKEKKTVRWVGFPHESQVSGLSFLTQERDEARQRVRDKVAKLKALLGQQIAYHQLISRNKAAVEAAVAAAPSAPGTTLETMRQTESPLPQAPPPPATMPDVSTPPTAAAAAAASDASSDASAAAAAAASAAALGATATDAEAAASSSSSAAAEAGAGSPALPGSGSSSDGARALSQRIQMPFLLVSTRRPSAIDCALSDDRTRAMLTFEDSFRIHDDTQVMRRLGLHQLPPADRRSLSQLLGRVEPRLRAELVRFHFDGSLPAAVPPSAAIAAAFNSFNSPLPPPPPPPLPLPPLSTVAAPALAASMFAAPAPGAEPAAIAATAQAPPPPPPPPPP